jgi:hypothetical protein
MSGGFGKGRALSNGQSYGSTTNLGGTKLTPSATANVPGAWTQLTASTSADSIALLVFAICSQNGYATVGGCSVDIGIGPSGSEVVLIAGLNLGPGASSYSKSCFNGTFPVCLPAGTRIAARATVNGASSTQIISAFVDAFDGGSPTGYEFAAVDQIGGVSAGAGTAISMSSDAKGGYAQLIASTSYDYAGFILGVDSTSVTVDGTSYYDVFDVAIGASGLEQIIAPNLEIVNGVASQINTDFIDVEIPAGSRIAVRGGMYTASAVNQNVTLYAVRA